MSRFPDDFMFALTSKEWENLKCQIGISSSTGAAPGMRSQTVTGSAAQKSHSSQSVMSSRASAQNSSLHGGRRGLPYAFTEQGIAMLSSVLRSPRAIEVNIAIMRTFVQLRRLMDSNRTLARRIEAMEKKYDEQFATVFDAIKRLIAEDHAQTARPKRRIGFLP